jgi:translation initiation factor 2 beta subunit (eIF-2beta)/eIF-5
MKSYDVRCPICGEVNTHLYLEETSGWMECKYCRHVIQVLISVRRNELLLMKKNNLHRNM